MNQKVQPTLSVVEIPLNQIHANGFNLRRTMDPKGIETLAASIKAHGLRQNLNVREVKGGFEVVAGHRRLAALQLLVTRGELEKNAKISCLVVEQGENAHEIALAENAMREQMHPADEFEAFLKLSKEGKSVEDIAARFGVTPAVVKQRLKLAAISPKLLDAYRAEEINLDQLMALTLTDDHKRQEKVWASVKDGGQWNNNPRELRKRLMEKSVDSDDRRVKFVTLEAYEAAKGPVTRDLFDTGRCYLDDPKLLDKLLDQKLKDLREKLTADGWGWVEIHTGSIPYGGDDYGYFNDANGHSAKSVKAADRPKCGVRVGFDTDGKPVYEYGRLTKAQLKEERKAAKAAAREAGEPLEADEDEAPEWSGPQLGEMGKVRTFALADAILGHNVHFSFRLMVHALALDLYKGESRFDAGSCTCLTVSARSYNGIRLENLDPEYPDEIPVSGTFKATYREWMKKLPNKPVDLWPWVMEASLEEIYDLLRFLTARSVDALNANNQQEKGLRHYQVLQQAFLAGNKGMTERWMPTAVGFVGRMSKKQMLKALTDAGKPDIAAEVAKLKKDEAAMKTAAELKDTGWLPAPLMVPERKEKKAPAKKKGEK